MRRKDLWFMNQREDTKRGIHLGNYWMKGRMLAHCRQTPGTRI